MLKQSLQLLAFITAAVCTVPGQQVAAQPAYSIDWYDISAGGGTSTGGAYALTGTIGQPDANPVAIGGAYKLVGGFLHGPRQTSGLKDWTLY